MNVHHRIKTTFVIVASEEHAIIVRKSGVRFVGQLDPKQGAEQIMFGDDVKPQWAAYENFIIALPPGMEELRDDLAVRLGDDRCQWATWPREETDATNVLAKARPMWTDEISTLHDIPDEGPVKVYKTGFPRLDEHGIRITLPAFMPCIGPYGSGKSVFLRQLVVNLWRQYGWKCLITSFEEKIKPTYHRDLRRHLIGKPVEDWTLEEEAKADDEIQAGFVFLRRKRKTTLDMERLLNRLEYAVKVHGVRVIMIDPVNEIDHQVGRGESKTDYMGRFIMALKALADDYNLLIIVAAHPPKDGVEKRLVKNGLLTLNDGADTAHWGNKADIGVCVWRRLDGATLLHIDKLKVHEINGKPTLAEMLMDRRLGRFYINRMGYEILGDDA